MRVAVLALCQGLKHDVLMIPTNTLLHLKFLTPTRSVTIVAQVRFHPADAVLTNVKILVVSVTIKNLRRIPQLRELVGVAMGLVVLRYCSQCGQGTQKFCRSQFFE